MLSCVAFSIALEYYPGVLLSCVAFGIAFRQDSGNVTLWSTLAYYPGVLPWSIALQGHTPNVMPETLLWAMLWECIRFYLQTMSFRNVSPSDGEVAWFVSSTLWERSEGC